MVFSPRRRSAVALASFLALAAGPLILPTTAGAAGSNVAVTDKSGDVVNGDDPPAASATPKADITGASVRYKNDFITFTMKLAEGDDLANPASLLFWFGSESTQSCCNIEVSLRKIASGYEVALGDPRNTETPLTTCVGSIASVDVANGTYAASVPASCIGSLPATLNLWAANRQVPITGGIATDRAPDTQSEPVTNAKVSGYWALGSDGKVYPFGDALKSGEPTSAALSMVDIEAVSRSAYATGYWTLDNKGVVNAYGPAGYVPVAYGSITDMKANEKAVSLSGTPTGGGYWIFTNLGRAVGFGDAAKNLGDVSSLKLNEEVLDSVATPSGKGYYLVAADGGVFALGDANFEGSMGGIPLNGPVQSLVPDPDGQGYWLVATDGGVFSFKALFKGSMGHTPLNKPMTGMVTFGDAYLMVAEDGGVFNFSNKEFSGSLGNNPPTNPIVSIAALN
jgi:hypothetical protein